jgi:hypothetical protein
MRSGPLNHCTEFRFKGLKTLNPARHEKWALNDCTTRTSNLGTCAAGNTASYGGGMYGRNKGQFCTRDDYCWTVVLSGVRPVEAEEGEEAEMYGGVTRFSNNVALGGAGGWGRALLFGSYQGP